MSLFNSSHGRVKPGWKKVRSSGTMDEAFVHLAHVIVMQGTTITFENEGDEAPGVIPADIQFILGEKPHDRFKREGNNLVYAARLHLADALCGGSVTVRTLDDRTLNIPITEVVKPDDIKVVPGEGMPSAKHGKGDLLIKFSIIFPSRVPESKKGQLRSLLTGL
jgi:DnaJ family protein B protein 4